MQPNMIYHTKDITDSDDEEQLVNITKEFTAQITHFMCCAASCRVHLRKQRSFLKPELAGCLIEHFQNIRAAT